MKTKEQNIKTGGFAVMVIVFVACVMLLCPSGVMAAGTVCSKTAAEICTSTATVPGSTTDCDGDGLTDYEECTGIKLTAGKSYQGVSGTSTTLEKLDPSRPDLFYMLATSSALDLTDANSLLFKNGTPQLYASALKVNLHKIQKADILAGSDRFLIWTTTTSGKTVTNTPRLKAALIMENTVGTGSLGITKEGNPLGPMTPSVASTIYTARISNNVNTNCAGIKCSIKGTNITNINSAGAFDNTPIINFYIQQVVSHELAHASFLAVPKSTVTTSPAYNSTATTTNYHYTDQSLMMAAASTFSKATNAAGATEGIYVIGTTFDPVLDKYGLTLK